MERLKELISQLMEQFDRKAEPTQMLQTAQLLEAELRLLATQPAPGRVMPTKIAVMMPSAARITASPSQPSPSQPASSTEASAKAAPPAHGAPASANTLPAATNGTPTPVAAINGTALAAATPSRGKEPERGVWPFDPLAEKPIDRFTLSQKSREINDIIGGTGASLNEKLKSDIVDLRSALNDAPVRDLKKAIGVNDRHVFVNQLFR